ncbi:MAG: hypothetical protein LBS45_06900 [Synergistaceae bacterium]|nr:hypothetical protein [Synergistaceae bacterium]
MRFTKRALWVVLLVLGFAVMVGGCGGGGGGESVAEVDFDALDGTWVITGGSGTASAENAYGEKLELKLNNGQGQIEFDRVALVGTVEATVNITYDALWDVYYNGASFPDQPTVTIKDTVSGVRVQRTGANKFSFTFLEGGSHADVTVNSNTSATVVESGSLVDDNVKITYYGTYNLTKSS